MYITHSQPSRDTLCERVKKNFPLLAHIFCRYPHSLLYLDLYLCHRKKDNFKAFPERNYLNKNKSLVREGRRRKKSSATKHVIAGSFQNILSSIRPLYYVLCSCWSGSNRSNAAVNHVASVFLFLCIACTNISLFRY